MRVDRNDRSQARIAVCLPAGMPVDIRDDTAVNLASGGLYGDSGPAYGSFCGDSRNSGGRLDRLPSLSLSLSLLYCTVYTTNTSLCTLCTQFAEAVTGET